MAIKKKLTVAEQTELLTTLQERFDTNPRRHKGIKWVDVEKRLKAKPAALASLSAMEITGGEPDVVAFDKKAGEYVFFDCSSETPIKRRSLCFDAAALKSRKENKPDGSAVGMATQMGISLLTETEYHALQKLGEFDLKTSSWILTPKNIRDLGGALFCDRRYDTVFTYHNGVESYYAVRGFRGSLRV